MNDFFGKLRDLWADSFWFRICASVCLIGTCMLIKTVAGAWLAGNHASASARDAVNQVQDGLADFNFSDSQEALLREGIESLTPEQRQQYDHVMSKLNQTHINGQP